MPGLGSHPILTPSHSLPTFSSASLAPGSRLVTLGSDPVVITGGVLGLTSCDLWCSYDPHSGFRATRLARTQTGAL